MSVLVTYDIPSDVRRRRVALALVKVATRVQWSVFLAERPTVAALASLLEPLIDPRDDNLRIHPLCAACRDRERLLGIARTATLPRGFRIV